MESGPMGLRQNRSREGSPSLNIRTGLSSWIRHWTQHSYIRTVNILLTMSSSSTPSPTIFCDGSDAFGDSIRQFDTSKKAEGYWGPSEVGSID